MDIVKFEKTGVYIFPDGNEPYRFNGSPEELIAIMIAHPELSIENAQFLVREVFNSVDHLID